MVNDNNLIIAFDVVLPAAGQKLTVYADFLLKLQEKQGFYNRSLGYSSWLQGKVLNLARKQCKKKGDWGKFLATVEVAPGKTMSPETARLCRRIADLVVESQAKQKTYIEMLGMVYPSFAKDLKRDAENETPTLIRKGTGKKRLPGESKGPLHPDKYQKRLRVILSNAQSLSDGMAEVGINPTAEVDLCRDCVRLADSAINELQKAKSVCETAIGKYPTSDRKVA